MFTPMQHLLLRRTTRSHPSHHAPNRYNQGATRRSKRKKKKKKKKLGAA
jgi:hypothetical protein